MPTREAGSSLRRTAARLPKPVNPPDHSGVHAVCHDELHVRVVQACIAAAAAVAVAWAWIRTRLWGRFSRNDSDSISRKPMLRARLPGVPSNLNLCRIQFAHVLRKRKARSRHFSGKLKASSLLEIGWNGESGSKVNHVAARKTGWS